MRGWGEWGDNAIMQSGCEKGPVNMPCLLHRDIIDEENRMEQMSGRRIPQEAARVPIQRDPDAPNKPVRQYTPMGWEGGRPVMNSPADSNSEQQRNVSERERRVSAWTSCDVCYI